MHEKGYLLQNNEFLEISDGWFCYKQKIKQFFAYIF